MCNHGPSWMRGKRVLEPRVFRSSPVCLATLVLEERCTSPYHLVFSERNAGCVVNAYRPLQRKMCVGYASTNSELQRRIKVMKYLLSGVAIVAALAFAAPSWAQRTGPGATAGTGTGPAVNPPGGPGPSSPLYNLPQGSPGIPGTPQSGYPASPVPAATGIVPGVPVPGGTTSAEPPTRRHARASTHHHG